MFQPVLSFYPCSPLIFTSLHPLSLLHLLLGLLFYFFIPSLLPLNFTFFLSFGPSPFVPSFLSSILSFLLPSFVDFFFSRFPLPSFFYVFISLPTLFYLYYFVEQLYFSLSLLFFIYFSVFLVSCKCTWFFHSYFLFGFFTPSLLTLLFKELFFSSCFPSLLFLFPFLSSFLPCLLHFFPKFFSVSSFFSSFPFSSRLPPSSILCQLISPLLSNFPFILQISLFTLFHLHK